MMQLTTKASAHIWPVYKIHNDGHRNQPVRFCGTGFVIPGGYFVTCQHCVEDPCGPEESYGFAYPAPNSPPGGAGLVPLEGLAADENGADLAIAKISPPVTPRLNLAGRPGVIGEDVYTLGFPLLPSPERQVYGNLIFKDVNRRFLRGYVTKSGGIEFPDGRRVDAIEVDMLVPPGLSGAPLLRLGTLDVVGVLFGNHSSYNIESISSVDPSTGDVTPEVRSQVSFGLALPTELLWDAKGPAFGGSTLRKCSPKK